MTVTELLSAVVPLLVAALNLLVAAYALAGPEGRQNLGFVAAPLGVAFWALAWFVSTFDPGATGDMVRLGAAGATLSVSGFAAAAARDLKGAQRWLDLSLIFLAAAGLGTLASFFGHPLNFGLVARALGLGAVAGLLLAAWWQRSEIGQKRIFWAILGVCLAWVVLAAGVLVFRGIVVDILLLLVLLAEVLALIQVGSRRVRVEVMLTRALTYLLLALVVAAMTALVFSELGYVVDAVVVAATVSIALTASALIAGLGDRLSLGFEQLLFPEQRKLARALEISRGELAVLRRRLEKAERLAIAGELAARVAHEIKNPLSPIRGYAQLLEGRLDAVGPTERPLFAKGLGIIKAETDRIDARIQELLGVARQDKDKASVEATASLPRILREAVAVAEAEPGVLRIFEQIEPGLDRVRGHEDELRSALLNLLKNAAEAMTQGGEIEVNAYRSGNLAVVEIKDQGPGISEDDAEKVFAAFYTTKAGGTGLGLAIARSAAESAGGSLSLGPRTDARGAIARLELPLEEP